MPAQVTPKSSWERMVGIHSGQSVAGTLGYARPTCNAMMLASRSSIRFRATLAPDNEEDRKHMGALLRGTRRFFRCLLAALVPLIILLLTVGLVTYSSTKLMPSVFAESAPADFVTDHTAPLGTDYVGVGSTIPREGLYDGDFEVVSMLVSGFHSQDPGLSITLQMGLGQALWNDLVDVTGVPIFDATTSRVKPQYADLPVTLDVDGYDPSFAVQIPYTLGDLATQTYQAPFDQFPMDTKTTSLTIPVTWTDKDFPRDHVYALALVSLALPANVVRREEQACVARNPSSPSTCAGMLAIPLKLQVAAKGQQSIEGWDGVVGRDLGPSSAPNLQGIIPLKILLTREQFTVAYTFGIALVPFALFLLLGLTVVHRRRKLATDGPKSLQTFILSLAATMLTVVPLRAVLVPMDIPNLTSVDLLLSVELLLLLALAALQHTLYSALHAWRTLEPARNSTMHGVLVAAQVTLRSEQAKILTQSELP